MFLGIFNWMLATAPRVVRGAVAWLVDGLRGITNHISARWASLGAFTRYWWERVGFWWWRANLFANRLATFAYWLVRTRIPQVIAATVAALRAYTNTLVAQVKAFLEGLIAGLRSWAVAAVNVLKELIAAVKTWTKYWLDKLSATLAALIRLLSHVLNGPEVLAEWLVAAMWRQFLRFLRAQQDRVASWLTRESVVFTRWLTTELENLIMRWL